MAESRTPPVNELYREREAEVTSTAGRSATRFIFYMLLSQYTCGKAESEMNALTTITSGTARA